MNNNIHDEFWGMIKRGYEMASQPAPLITKGIEPICGWEWIQQHRHDLDGWHPTIEISRPGSKFTTNLKDQKYINQVAKEILRNN